MSLRVVRLGTPRRRGEGPRIGAVRHPPRGVPKHEHASRNFYDVWLPELAPSAPLVKLGLAAETDRQWQGFVRRYRREMGAPERKHLLELLAVLSLRTNLSVGCYCEDAARCHRSVLGELLADHGAKLALGAFR